MNNGFSGSRADRAADVVYWLFLLAGCIVFLVMNFYTTVKEDDLFHATIGGGSTRPINNLLDVLRSWREYYQHDARLANIISFTFNGLLNKTAFNIVNTVVFGLMAHLLSRLATHRNSVMALVMLYTYMVTAMPVPGETLLWEVASFNFMWNLTASMLFVIYLLKHRDGSPGWGKGALVFLLSMFAGGINEGTTFGVFGGLVLYFLFHRDKLDRAVVIAMTGYLMGVLLLLTCPGAWGRASMEVSHDAGVMSLLASRLHTVTRMSLGFVTPLAALVVLFLAMFRSSDRKVLLASPWPPIFLVLLAFVFVVGKDQQRLYFAMTMIGLLIVIAGFYRVLLRLPWLRVAVVLVGLLICARLYPGNIRTMKRYQAFFNQVDTDIRQTPGRQVILEERLFNGYSRFIKPFNFQSWIFFIREETLCYHYDKDNIQFVPTEVYKRYHEGTLLEDVQPMPFTSPDCSAFQQVLASPEGGFMAVKTDRDTILHSYQFAHAFKADGTPSQSLVGYFPLLYEGREYLIFPMIDDSIERLTFAPFSLEGDAATLIRTAPNPAWTESKE